jgi:hypothetical protein
MSATQKETQSKLTAVAQTGLTNSPIGAAALAVPAVSAAPAPTPLAAPEKTAKQQKKKARKQLKRRKEKENKVTSASLGVAVSTLTAALSPASSVIAAPPRASARTAATPTTPVDITQVPAQVIFGVADLKLCNGKVKLLEFGDGYTSGFKDIPQLMKSVEECLSAKLKLPVYNSLQILQNAQLLLPLQSRDVPILSDYQGVHNTQHRAPFWNFQNSKIMLVNNSAIWVLVNQHKNLFFETFSKAGCLDAIPRSQVYWWNDDLKNLAQRIKNDIPAKMYALKAPHACDGNGVFIVEAEDLEITLPILLGGKTKEEVEALNTQYQKALQKKKSDRELGKDITAAQLWRMVCQESPEFVVQEYCASDLLEVVDKKYDATLRVGFIITLNAGKIEFHPLKSYWKLPVNPANTTELRDRTVSNVHEGIGRVDTDLKTQAEVFQQLQPIMTQVFQQIFTAQPLDYIESLIHEDDKRRQYKGVTSALHYIEGLNELHLYSDTFALLPKIKDTIFNLQYPNCAIRYSHLMGEAQLFTGQYQAAIRSFTDAIDTLLIVLKNRPNYPNVLQRLAECYLARGIAYTLLSKKLTNKDDKSKAKEKGDIDKKEAKKMAASCNSNEHLQMKYDKIKFYLKDIKIAEARSQTMLVATTPSADQTALLLSETKKNAKEVTILTNQTYNKFTAAAAPQLDLSALETRFYNPPFDYINRSPYGFLSRINVNGQVLSLYFRDFASKYVKELHILDADLNCQVLKETTDFHTTERDNTEAHYHIWYKNPINVTELIRFLNGLQTHEVRFVSRYQLCFADPDKVTTADVAHFSWLPASERANCLQAFIKYMGTAADKIVLPAEGVPQLEAPSSQAQPSAATQVQAASASRPTLPPHMLASFNAFRQVAGAADHFGMTRAAPTPPPAASRMDSMD